MSDQDQSDTGDVAFMIEDISPDSWQCREVFAKFGLALYAGQVLEHEIINLIVWSGISTGTYASRDDMETEDVELFRKTMGKLKNVLMSRRIDLAHLEDELIRAVTLRNFLAHSYFRERVNAFANIEGRDQMIAELDRATAFFEHVDAQLTTFTRKIVGSFDLLEKMPELMKEAEKTKEFGQPLPGFP